MDTWYLTSEMCHQFSSTVQNMSCLQRVFFSADSICFACLLSQLGKKEIITEKSCAGAEIVPPADSIRAGWCFHSLRCRVSKFRSILQSRWLHCEFSVDFKNWQVCTVAYKLGLLLPLLFSEDMNKFLSKGNVLSGELSLCYIFRFDFVSGQLA